MDSSLIFFVGGFLCGVAFLPTTRIVVGFLKRIWLILLIASIAFILLWQGSAIVKAICDLCNQVCQ